METASNIALDMTLGMLALGVPVALGIAAAILFDIARKVYALVIHGKL